MDKMYLVSEERYRELLKSELELICLENQGVDNWQWYDFRWDVLLEDYFEKDGLEDNIPKIIEHIVNEKMSKTKNVNMKSVHSVKK